MAKTITVTITPDGKTVLAVKGAPGSSCKDLTKSLEAALGHVTDDTNTPEYHQHVSQKDSNLRIGGR